MIATLLKRGNKHVDIKFSAPRRPSISAYAGIHCLCMFQIWIEKCHRKSHVSVEIIVDKVSHLLQIVRNTSTFLRKTTQL
jgi:hypothetical protein